MATTEKILGQKATAATTEWDLYNSPASTSTIITSINVCNRVNTATTFRISIGPEGDVTANDHYLYYDYPIEGLMTLRLDNLRWTMQADYDLRVYAGNANLTFIAFGSERSV